ncbi:MAG: hypothetical protein WC980_06875 [Candidatus Brocadiia bacterium]
MNTKDKTKAKETMREQIYCDSKRERGALYSFPPPLIINFYKQLPIAKNYKQVDANIRRKIVVVTMDDNYDLFLDNLLAKNNVPATWFPVVNELVPELKNKEVEFHFNKDMGSIESQKKKFIEKMGYTPRINRNHRLWWRSDNIDFAYLSLHGILADSTKIGITPYKPCVQGRILPIWEIPFAFFEPSCVSVMRAGYSLVENMETLFRNNVTPIVGTFHPLNLEKYHHFSSQLEKFIRLGRKYHYNFMSLKQLLNLLQDQ